jgi:autotransporter-associated beta strand protein
VAAWSLGMLATALSADPTTPTDSTYLSADTPQFIPDFQFTINPVVANSQIRVTNVATEITTIKIALYITHEFPNDLRIWLIPPNPNTGEAGDFNNPQHQRILLTNRIYPPSGNANLRNGLSGTTGYGIPPQDLLADLYNPITSGRVIFAVLDPEDQITSNDPLEVDPVNYYIKPGEYSPATVPLVPPGINFVSLSSLSGRIGLAVNGIWTLRVEDREIEGTGYLQAWSIRINEPGVHVWRGGTDTNWGTAANWVDNNAPSLSEQNAFLVFPTGVTHLTANNNIGTMRVHSLKVAGGYTLAGDSAIRMSNNSIISVSPGTTSTATLNGAGRLELFQKTNINVESGATLVVEKEIVDVNEGTPQTTSGSLVKLDAGTLTLTAANLYNGPTTISAGVLEISNPSSLGSTSGGTVVSNGATLAITAPITISGEDLSISGTGSAGQGAIINQSGGAAVYDSEVELIGVEIGIGATGLSSLEFNSLTSTGDYRLLKIMGGGTVTFDAALPSVTDLSVIGSTLVTTVNQNIGALTLNAGRFRPDATVALGGNITSSGVSELETGTGVINVAGRTAFVSSTLTVRSELDGSMTIRGSGTTDWQSTSTQLSVSLNGGTMTGAGRTGNLSVSTGRLAFSGGAGHTTENLNLGSNAWFTFTDADSMVTASGAVTISDAVLQPFSDGVIIANSNNSGAFRFYPRTGSIVNYNLGSGNIVLGSPGNTVGFSIAPYSTKEGDGSIQLSLTSSGPVNVAITSAGGQLDPGADFTEISSTAINGATPVSLRILDDFVSEGTESGQLIIVPLNGLLSGDGNASLTINDNDEDETKPCGFGTGLTVFMLFGFGLLLSARLRRR